MVVLLTRMMQRTRPVKTEKTIMSWSNLANRVLTDLQCIVSSHASRALKLLWYDSKVKGVKSQTTDTVDVLLLVCIIAKPKQLLEK